MSERINKLNSLVRQEVAQIIKRELEFPGDSLVTVTRAAVADDAESATLWVSVLPEDAGPKILEIIERNIGAVQKVLNRRLVMKFVPRIRFKLDTQHVKAEQVAQLLDEIAEEENPNPDEHQ